MTPFLKWAGGKRWLVAKHSRLFPTITNRYIEPFLGSGAVFFHLEPAKAILSDLNEELIDTYLAIRDDSEGVQKALRAHHRQHDEEYYYKVREQNLRTPTTRAARFIYLNRTCFNGLYRVNLKGVFNVPKGTKENVIRPEDDFPAIAKLLRRPHILARDFSETISEAGEGDFVYVDPPYTVRHNKNNFIKYNEKIFSWSDQKRLAESLRKATKKGAQILISNANHSCISELYDDKVWTQLEISRHSILASKPEHRKGTSELIISNYLDSQGRGSEVRT